MARYADDSFGNMVNVLEPYGRTTRVYCRIDGSLSQFDIGTADHEKAIEAVRHHLGHHKLNRYGRWNGSPVLAIIDSKETA